MLRATDHGPITRIRLARTFFGRPLYSVCAYLVDGVLIDNGPPATARQLVRWLRPRPPRLVLNTHYHEDHSGANAALQRKFGVRVLAPAASLSRLADFYRLPFYRALVWGQPGDVKVEAMPEVVDTGRYRFHVVPTPGHAPDHVCLFEPDQGWLFSGDLYIHERVTYTRMVEDVWQHIASLRRVLALEPRLLLCAHAGVVHDPKTAITAKIAFWEGLAERIRALAEQSVPLREIRSRLLGREGWMTWVSRGDFSKLNMIRALLRDPLAAR
jgi:glyoxylase-like metal-dependent hydrolase (beta-lactamase superfamily II)